MTVSSSSEDTSSPLVHFEGNWSTDETDLIQGAVAEAEAASWPSSVQSGAAPWIATCHDEGATPMYAASRTGVSRVLSAQSADALAEKIRTFVRSEDLSVGSGMPRER
jgi:hypothetical protein